MPFIREFLFQTGVRPVNRAKLLRGERWHMDTGGLTIVVPFRCEGVPHGAIFKCGCDDPNLYPDSNLLVREILPGSGLHSKHAYFHLTTHCPAEEKDYEHLKLDPFDWWMVRCSVEKAQTVNLQQLCSILRDNGYHRVAEAVELAVQGVPIETRAAAAVPA